MPDLLDTLLERVKALSAPVRVEPGQRSAVAIRRFVEGATNEAGLRAELRLLGYGGHQLERLALGARMELDLAVRQAKADALALDFRARRLDEGTLKASLLLAGFQPEAAELRVKVEVARRPPQIDRPVAVGLVVQTAPADTRPDQKDRPTAVGLVITADPAAARPDPRPRPVTVGLEIVVQRGLVVELAPHRPVAVGLQILVAQATSTPDPRPRPVTVGLQIIVRRGG